MKTILIGIRTVLFLLSAAGLACLSGCASGKATPPVPSGFLTYYCPMEQVDNLTWRHIDADKLANYDKFRFGDVKVLATDFNGKELSQATKQKIEDYIRQSITKALASRYSMVKDPGPNVADIRAGITSTYKTGNQLGLTVESEILDSQTRAQLAVVMKTELSQPYFSDYW